MAERYAVVKEQRLRELSQEYERDGYRVVIHPQQAELPTFLTDFTLYRSAGENYMVGSGGRFSGSRGVRFGELL